LIEKAMALGIPGDIDGLFSDDTALARASISA
jgi:hypothetical protein